MTYATDRGLKLGQSYTLQFDDNDVPKGTTVKFIEDDGTECVKFEVPKEFDRDGWTYLVLDSINPTPTPVTEPKIAPAFSVNVEFGSESTTVTIKAKLTAAQVAKILEVVGVE